MIKKRKENFSDLILLLELTESISLLRNVVGYIFNTKIYFFLRILKALKGNDLILGLYNV